MSLFTVAIWVFLLKRKPSSSGKKSDAKKPAAKAKGDKIVNIPPAIEEFCRAERARAANTRQQHILNFKAQAGQVAELLLKAPRAVFADILNRTMVGAEEEASKLQIDFDAERSVLLTQQAEHLTSLKPSLALKHDHRLPELCKAETVRQEKSETIINKHTEALVALEMKYARMFVQRLLHCTTLLLRLVDSVLGPMDLHRTEQDELLIKRMSLKMRIQEANRLAKMEAAAAAGAASKAAAGGKGGKAAPAAAVAATASGEDVAPLRMFAEWTGLRLDQLAADTPEAAAALVQHLEQAAREALGVDKLRATILDPPPADSAKDTETASAGQSPARGKAPAKGAKPGAKEAAALEAPEEQVALMLSPTVGGYDIPANWATISARDQAFKSYLVVFRQRVLSAKHRAKEMLKEEHAHRELFTARVSRVSGTTQV